MEFSFVYFYNIKIKEILRADKRVLFLNNKYIKFKHQSS